MIQDDWIRLVWTIEATRRDSRQSDWDEIKISWRKIDIRPWLLIASCWAERYERQRKEEAIHRRNSESEMRQWILRTWTCLDYNKSNIRDVDEQSKQYHRICECCEACDEERLYNLSKQNDRNEKQNHLYEQIDRKRRIVRKVQLRTENCKSWNDDVASSEASSINTWST